MIKQLLLYLFPILAVCQEIPKELIYNDFINYEYDLGNNWDELSLISSNRWINYDNRYRNNDSTKYYLDIFFFGDFKNQKFENAIGFHSHAFFKKYFYTFLYGRIVSNPTSFPRYTGLSRDIKRLGFQSGEVDQSGIGYESDNFLVQYGRGRISLGAGNEDIQISLSSSSPSYEHLVYGFKLNNWDVRFFSGFLERISNYNRYISGKSIEKKIGNNFIIAFSELIIYSGENRNLDFAFINPISSHLEVEFNDRQNNLGLENANAIWELSMDFKFKKARFSTNFIIDEFVLDKTQIEDGKINSIGGAFRLSATPFFNSPSIVSYMNYVSLGTYMYKHSNGLNNFIQREKPLGWYNGNDCKQLDFGLITATNGFYISKIEFSIIKVGENSILFTPYTSNENLNKLKSFPSGKIEIKKMLSFDFQYLLTSNTSFSTKVSGVIVDSENFFEGKFHFSYHID